jgi:hypothetical protein
MSSLLLSRRDVDFLLFEWLDAGDHDLADQPVDCTTLDAADDWFS